ncbi:Phosphopantetheine binding ACP domain [Dillenia turbinata]|uniref:Phosphopantetheine binding ACP domain n=1 Tax=Dillenia turbinata TaxID=194707 RepID=A0AAN8ZK45_9MAGN
MDSGKSVEDQFCKLHPSMPTNTRICIVGAGPSGLSAAYALVRLGYTNVTILEKSSSVGGMCESVDINGKVYDLGGQVLAANSAPSIFHIAKEIGAQLEEMDSHKFAYIDSSSGDIQEMKLVDDYVSVISMTLKLQDQAKSSGRIGVHAVSEIASDSTPTFLKGHGFESVPKSVAHGYTASGYGFIQDMPYAYVHEFTRTSMAGKIRRFKGGYGNFWQKVSKSLPVQVFCSTEVLRVRRNQRSISVTVRDSDGEASLLEFDKIIMSGAFPFTTATTYRSSQGHSAESTLLDTSELEMELFSKVRTIDYYTTVLEIIGLEHIPMGFYYFPEFMDDPATIGHPVAMQRFYADTNVFLFWSYGNSDDVQGPQVIESAISTVQRMGGEVKKVVLERRFKYFPHVTSKDMKEGFYDRLELELQGQRNSYYIGGLMAFELTERNSSYAMALVCKHFANDSPLPLFPYVKRLNPWQSNQGALKHLEKLPGVEFPDLHSLDAYLRYWGTHSVISQKTLYTWINDKGEVVGQRSFADLHKNASRIAHKLMASQNQIIGPGDRVLLVYVPGLDFVDAFFGCLRAKVIPVPAIPPDPMHRGGQALLHIENIAKSCQAVAILSTSGYHTSVRAVSVKNMLFSSVKNDDYSANWPNLPWLHTDSWTARSVPEGTASEPNPLPSDLCFLQFTSGSTGDAKGVMITHGGLIHNVKLMRRRYKSTSKTVLVSWLPQYHDMGLIGGLFTSLVSGGSAILFSPTTFIKHPLLWLHTMSKYRATHSAAPNFAFELIVRRLESQVENVKNMDLSSMVFLMVAAEPVRPKTMKRFMKLTGPHGLSPEVFAPGYGLAENCVFVSCAYGEGKPILVDWEGRVSCGYVDPSDKDVDIRIVDPETAKEHEDSTIEGEIWISSPSAGIGYWGKEELSPVTFRNELQYSHGKSYTRTGDLGRVIEGNLFITGRIKELIIVAGRNIYPSDVEKTVESSSEFLRPGCCAVIGVSESILLEKGISFIESPEEVGIVVVAEVRDGKPITVDAIEWIKTRVAEEHGITVASVVLLKPRTIPKTTSGKIMRHKCLKQFIDGNLDVVESPIQQRSLHQSITPMSDHAKACQPKAIISSNPVTRKKEIIEFLKGLLSEQTGITLINISVTESLMSYGVDSIGVVRAAQKLSQFLGVPVGAMDIFTATSIEDLANFAENLVLKSQSQSHSKATFSHPQKAEPKFSQPITEVPSFHKFCIWLLQLVALAVVSSMLTFPAYISISAFFKFILNTQDLLERTPPLFYYLIPITTAPLSWLVCMLVTCTSMSFFGNSFLRPNFALSPEISIWSVDFVRWWALYKAQEVAGKVLAVHLRGTVFIKYWFELLGAKIGSYVLLDTIDITDPSLVSIGSGTVVAEGAVIQSHEVKNGMLSIQPVRIGRNCSIGPYAVVQKGSVLEEEAEVPALQKSSGEAASKKLKPSKCYEVSGPIIAYSPPPFFLEFLSEYPLIIPKIKALSVCLFVYAFVKPNYWKLISDEMQTEFTKEYTNRGEMIYHFMGIYLVGLLSTLSAVILYFMYLWLTQRPTSLQWYSFFCLTGAFHWFPFVIVAYAIIFTSVPLSPIHFAISIAIFYLAHGLVLSILTCSMTRLLAENKAKKQTSLKTWLSNRIITSCHVRFSKLLSGTEAFCMYLRLLGAKVGSHCSIRAINPVSCPQLISVGNGVHLGDFSRIIAGFYSPNGFIQDKIEIHDNSVLGSQSIVLPGSVIQKDVILGALSVAPMKSILRSGGVFVGSQAPVMIKNTMHALDDRIEEMDEKYKKVLGNLAANLAATTLKVKARYFHRIGAAGKGNLRLFEEIAGLPDHKIFSPGKKFRVVMRHSNCLSSDDDARLDPRGTAIRIFSDETADNSPLLDLTLKTGNAFHAGNIADFATWLVCGAAAREEFVKHAPHVREAMWSSLRRADSYTELHYYSNICRLFRFEDRQEMYVKFKLRPFDETISEDSGRVEPTAILPPETGAIPRDENDTRPLLFLDKDFQQRVNSPGGVRYILQLQIRPIPQDEASREIVLDCTKPWDATEFPYIDVGEVTIDEILTREESETLEFNPFIRCHEVDVIRATSCSQSASMDHGRSIIYEICQHLRNRKPLPEAWKVFVEKSEVKVDLSGCPMAAALTEKDAAEVTLERTRHQTLWLSFAQPLLQTAFPHFLLGLVVFAPLNSVLFLTKTKKVPLHGSLPLFWVSSGILAALACAVTKWILVGKKKESETVQIWSMGTFMDTVWQAFRTLVGDYFMDMASGSCLFGLWMSLMGSNIAWDKGVYVDSMGAVLNPEMVEIEAGGCIGRDALLFGHIYEGEGGKVKFGKIRVGEGAIIGTKAVAMPGVKVENGGHLSALSLAMKEEIIR